MPVWSALSIRHHCSFVCCLSQACLVFITSLLSIHHKVTYLLLCFVWTLTLTACECEGIRDHKMKLFAAQHAYRIATSAIRCAYQVQKCRHSCKTLLRSAVNQPPRFGGSWNQNVSSSCTQGCCRKAACRQFVSWKVIWTHMFFSTFCAASQPWLPPNFGGLSST